MNYLGEITKRWKQILLCLIIILVLGCLLNYYYGTLIAIGGVIASPLLSFFLNRLWEYQTNKKTEPSPELTEDQILSRLQSQISVNMEKASDCLRSIYDHNKSLSNLKVIEVPNIPIDNKRITDIMSIIDTTRDINNLISERENLIIKMNDMASIWFYSKNFHLINGNLKAKIEKLVEDSKLYLQSD